ncbi:GNAT family N-acetyltransferase [Candidatus Berkiella aquae]|uniref:GNAT family N-acetyltransferase n=1 Tax=Candidatus Berkiella aquae TaxID=295108 RepID=A0A0Q9YSK5_9GAMM|nr:GNAT family N-acetyltransferase [Candidatus Berkiella aquae]MCS5711646.1 GNAT family N-acetyltransferase [Candidatus Berkiella aquae]
MTKALLRYATTDDIHDIAKVYLRSRKELVAFAPLAHSDDNIHEWVRNTLLPNEQVIVAEKNVIIIGMMSLTSEDEKKWIKQLYIHPDSVGQGVGTLMIKKAKSILGSPIYLYTFEKNIGAKRFYEKHGFLAIDFDDGSGNEEHCPAILYRWIE